MDKSESLMIGGSSKERGTVPDRTEAGETTQCKRSMYRQCELPKHYLGCYQGPYPWKSSESTVKKIHYKLPDEREMVEEYNTDTGVLVRRAWKVRGGLGGEGNWDIEIGDPVPGPKPAENVAIVESSDQPTVTRRNTRINLEWRIRNLSYPIETYSISANKDDGCIVVRTTNKKYFKKLPVPELQRINLPVEQANIQSSHKFNTLIILYKKPAELLEMEKELFEELKKVTPKLDTDIPADCKPS